MDTECPSALCPWHAQCECTSCSHVRCNIVGTLKKTKVFVIFRNEIRKFKQAHFSMQYRLQHIPIVFFYLYCLLALVNRGPLGFDEEINSVGYSLDQV